MNISMKVLDWQLVEHLQILEKQRQQTAPVASNDGLLWAPMVHELTSRGTTKGDTSPYEDIALNGDMLAARSEQNQRLRLTVCFPGFHQKQTQNPAAKFSTLLVHWLQTYSIIDSTTLFTQHNPLFKSWNCPLCVLGIFGTYLFEIVFQQ